MFVGHLGGDDFFVGLQQKDLGILELRSQIKKINLEFSDTVATFYSKEEFLQGYYISKDRQGNERMFPLLSSKAAILDIPSGNLENNYENVLRLFANFKKKAKMAKEGITVLNLKDQFIEEQSTAM